MFTIRTSETSKQETTSDMTINVLLSINVCFILCFGYDSLLLVNLINNRLYKFEILLTLKTVKKIELLVRN